MNKEEQGYYLPQHFSEFEVFYDEVKDLGGQLMITIPLKLANYTGFKKGDKVKVMIRKKVEE